MSRSYRKLVSRLKIPRSRSSDALTAAQGGCRPCNGFSAARDTAFVGAIGGVHTAAIVRLSTPPTTCPSQALDPPAVESGSSAVRTRRGKSAQTVKQYHNGAWPHAKEGYADKADLTGRR